MGLCKVVFYNHLGLDNWWINLYCWARARGRSQSWLFYDVETSDSWNIWWSCCHVFMGIVTIEILMPDDVINYCMTVMKVFIKSQEEGGKESNWRIKELGTKQFWSSHLLYGHLFVFPKLISSFYGKAEYVVLSFFCFNIWAWKLRRKNSTIWNYLTMKM